jgi:DNA-binding transcriptional ArsR family regulator
MLDQLLNGHDSVETLARVLRLLSDPTRLRLLGLMQTEERNVSWLCQALSSPQPTVSHHLALLRNEGLITNRRVGKEMFYGLNDEKISRCNGSSGLRIDAGPAELRLEAVGAKGASVQYRAAAV